MGDLLETYPRLSDNITRARQAGYSDEEIQGHLQGKMQAAFKAGYSPEEVNAYLGQVQQPSIMEPIAGTAKTLGSAVAEVPGAILDMAKSVGKAAITPPKEGMFDISHAPERLLDVAKGVASGVTAGIYQPEATDEAQSARQTLGSLAGFAAPFGAATKAAEALGAGRLASEVIAGAVTGAAAPAVQGNTEGAVKGAVTGGVIGGAFNVASRVFKSFYDRLPKNVDEVKAAYRSEPVFAEALAEELGAEVPKEEPYTLSSKEVVDKIESQQNPKFFDREDMTKKVEDAGDTYVKTEVPVDELKTRPGVKAGESVPDKGAIVTDDEGKVIDGNHRTVDAKANGEQTIEAYVPEGSSIEERLKAAEAENAKLKEQVKPVEKPAESVSETPAGLRTLSGREIEPPIQKGKNTDRGVKSNVLAVDSWLVEQGKAEARAQGNDFAYDQFDRIDPKKITRAERDGLNVFLFGKEEVPLPRETGKTKPAPQQKLEDSEVRPSTFIKRYGGLKIPKELKEEFGGWNRLNSKNGLAPDEMAERMYEQGLIERPDTNALLDALKSGKKSARGADAFTGQLESDIERHIDNLSKSETGLEYKGHDYEGIEKAAAKDKYVLKDDPDKVISRKQALEVEEKVPFDIPAEEPARTSFQKTEDGMQGMIAGTEGRSVPEGALAAQRAQTEAPTELEQSTFENTQQSFPVEQPGPSVSGILASERGEIQLPDLSEEFESAQRTINRTNKIADHLIKARKIKAAMSYTKDAGDNAAALFGRQMSNDIRGTLRRAFGKDSATAEQALSFVIEANGVPDNLVRFRDQIMDSEATRAGYKKRLPDILGFARDHWDTLNQVARRYGDITDMELAQEHEHGIPTTKISGGYVMHVHDIADEGIGSLVSGGNEPAGFKHIRTHATFADAIAAGLDPKTVNSADLLEARLNRGQRMIVNKKWLDGLRGLTDPQTNAPVVADMQVTRRADGTVDALPPAGYSMQRVGFQPIAVKNGYEGTFSALTDPSWFSKSIASRNFLKANGIGKSINLLFDTFHLGRVAYWESMIKALGIDTFKAPLPSYRKGVTLMDYTPGEIQKMADAGEIPGHWVNGLQEELRKTNLAVQTGYNVARISDALHQDWAHNIKGIGTYNKWLFDKFQRGAMREAWSLEFDRIKGARPELSDHEAARTVSADLNTRFGNLGRQGLIKSRTAQDIARMVALAPQWNEGLIRSEIGAVQQLGQFGVDLAKGRGIYAGVLLRSVGGMVLGQFIANQIINQYTRGKFTWENPEEELGAKLSAWVPDVVGNGPGFFLHPLGLAAETTHLLLQGYERTDDWHKTLMTYVRSRSSAAMRPVLTFLTGQDFLGRSLKPGTVWSEIVKSAIPTPIPGGAVTGAAKQIATGEHGEAFPGQFQKQLMASAGIKTEQAPSPEQRITRLARDYNTKRGIGPNVAFFAGDYNDFSNALRMNNMTDARSALDELLKIKTPTAVLKHYESWAGRPFTGNKAEENSFVLELTPEQRQQYMAARQSRRQIAGMAQSLVGQKFGNLRNAVMGKKAVNQ